MPKVKEEPQPKVPAFMATFADLMTLLLVFFILLNVYAKERQYGLLAAASGSFNAAIMDTLGLGGVHSGSRFVQEFSDSQRTFRHHDEGGEKQASATRRGDEIELGKLEKEGLDATEQVEIGAPFTFAHGSADLPAKARDFLDKLARDLGGGNYFVELQASASFLESMRPMELACERIERVMGYLRGVGVRAEIEAQAGVTAAAGRGGRDAAYRDMSVRITRRR